MLQLPAFPWTPPEGNLCSLSGEKPSNPSPRPIPLASSLDMVSDDDESEKEDLDEDDHPTTPVPEDSPTPTPKQNAVIDSDGRSSAVQECQIPREPITDFDRTGFSRQLQTRLQEFLALAEFQ
jgi:hypothetical protein